MDHDFINRTSVVSTRPVFCRELIVECLSTHLDLTDEDLKFAQQVDCQNLTDSQLAVIIVHLCKTTDIGKFSLCYNYDVDVAIIRRDSDRWAKLLEVDHKTAFPEYYQQLSNFTSTEQKSIERAHAREYNAAFNLVKSASTITPPYPQYLIKSCPESFTSVKKDSQRKITLYQNCLAGVCVAEEISSKFIPASTSSDDTGIVMVPSRESGLTKVECFKIIDLVQAVSIDPPINPTTQKPFDPLILKMIRDRLAKEIKLYKYFLLCVNQIQ